MLQGWGAFGPDTPGGGMKFDSGKEHEKVAFLEWKAKEKHKITSRGEGTPEEEEGYIKRMTKALLRSHVCYKEVDEYSECLVAKRVVTEEELVRADVDMKLAKAKCAKPIARYNACMSRGENHRAVTEAAIGAEKCEMPRRELQVCLEQRSGDQAVQEEQCMPMYRRLLRCGLNNMYDEYWKAIAQFGTEEELHLYETEHNKSKQVELLDMKNRYSFDMNLPSFGGDASGPADGPPGSQN